MGEVVPIRPKTPKRKFIRSCIREAVKDAQAAISGEPIGAVIVVLGHDLQMVIQSAVDPSFLDEFDLYSRAEAAVKRAKDSCLDEAD